MADLAERLTALAKTANAQGATDGAAALFDAAHAIGGKVHARISAANMRLKLQQPERACDEFDAMLSQSPPLDPKTRALVLRKRGDALVMIESGSASEVVSAPLRIDPSIAAATAAELKSLGSSLNADGQSSIAACAYSAAFALTPKRELRISAANMTLKTGGAANARIAANEYDAICTEAASSGPPLSDSHRALIHRKREAASTILAASDATTAAPSRSLKSAAQSQKEEAKEEAAAPEPLDLDNQEDPTARALVQAEAVEGSEAASDEADSVFEADVEEAELADEVEAVAPAEAARAAEEAAAEVERTEAEKAARAAEEEAAETARIEAAEAAAVMAAEAEAAEMARIEVEEEAARAAEEEAARDQAARAAEEEAARAVAEEAAAAAAAEAERVEAEDEAVREAEAAVVEAAEAARPAAEAEAARVVDEAAAARTVGEPEWGDWLTQAQQDLHAIYPDREHAKAAAETTPQTVPRQSRSSSASSAVASTAPVNVVSSLKIIVVGDSGVGKSALVRRFAKDVFDDAHGPTIGLDVESATVDLGQAGGEIKLDLWDSAGQERFAPLLKSYYRGAGGVIYVFDLTSAVSLQRIEDYWTGQVASNRADEATALLVGSKADASPAPGLSDKARGLADRLGLPYIEVSSKTGEHVSDAFHLLAMAMLNKRLEEDPRNPRAMTVSNKSGQNASPDTRGTVSLAAPLDSSAKPGKKGSCACG